jgi:hypothetical protein
MSRLAEQKTSTKKVRRIAAIIYILFMAFIVGGTLLHQSDTTTASQNAVDEFSHN